MIPLFVWLCACAAARPPPDPGGRPGGTPVARPSPPPVPRPRALFDRLGGRPAIDALAGALVQEITSDERINAPFAMTDLASLRRSFADFLCARTGGPCVWHGRDLRAIHEGMGITGAQFGVFIEDLARVLDRLGARAGEKQDMIETLGALRGQIVEAP